MFKISHTIKQLKNSEYNTATMPRENLNICMSREQYMRYTFPGMRGYHGYA